MMAGQELFANYSISHPPKFPTLGTLFMSLQTRPVCLLPLLTTLMSVATFLLVCGLRGRANANPNGHTHVYAHPEANGDAGAHADTHAGTAGVLPRRRSPPRCAHRVVVLQRDAAGRCGRRIRLPLRHVPVGGGARSHASSATGNAGRPWARRPLRGREGSAVAGAARGPERGRGNGRVADEGRPQGL